MLPNIVAASTAQVVSMGALLGCVVVVGYLIQRAARDRSASKAQQLKRFVGTYVTLGLVTDGKLNTVPCEGRLLSIFRDGRLDWIEFEFLSTEPEFQSWRAHRYPSGIPVYAVAWVENAEGRLSLGG